MDGFSSSASAPEAASEWCEAIAEMKERLQDERKVYLEFERQSLEAVSGLRDAIEQDVLSASDEQQKQLLLRALEGCDLVDTGCRSLCASRSGDIDAMLIQADAVEAHIVAACQERDVSEVSAELEGSDVWQKLLGFPDRGAQIFAFEQLTNELIDPLFSLLDQDAGVTFTREQLWRVSSLNAGSDGMYSAILSERVYDGEVSRLLPGLAGDGLRAAKAGD